MLSFDREQERLEGSVMRINWFLFFGVLILLLGWQVRKVDQYVLNENSSSYLEARTSQATVSASPYGSYLATTDNSELKTLQPPEWLGWSLLSVGVVLVLTSPLFGARAN